MDIKSIFVIALGLESWWPRKTYYHGTHAVIVVMDCTDRARVTLIKDELFRLLRHEDRQHFVILVFANKQDIKDAKTAKITDALSLRCIKTHDWHIQACCALTGYTLYDGLGWTAQQQVEKGMTGRSVIFSYLWIQMTEAKSTLFVPSAAVIKFCRLF
ncbi:hypothetical protein ES288_D10G176900v1 [Gossypium darwinii]|uniref:Uncharacterized protein n=1 Tax=Gossypium darwinii TaxID=34276 RepID=A0A5D2B1L9_GOSDA|nr:hypothetical protein GOBAR_DD12377 [Gossypium barbadense]TYG50458.1 hypothetical protein ES288_D10G176900v1 [Gossypium darwinii]